MEERAGQPAGHELPVHPEAEGPTPVSATAGPPHLADPRALTILTTEHWGLLTARSLVYNEAFSRAGMFMTFVTGSLVALGFVSQASGFSREFLIVAAVVLGIDLLIGLTTLGRISDATVEEFRALQGMARLRHAYLEMVPTLRPYLSTSDHDDFRGVLEAYASASVHRSVLVDVAHGLTTTTGMVGLICSVVAGALGAALVLLTGAAGVVAIAGALGAAVGLFVVLTVFIVRSVGRIDRSLEVRFPRPAGDAALRPPPPG